MASKLALFLVSAFILVAAGVSRSEEDFKDKDHSKVIAPIKAPIQDPPPAKYPPTPSPPAAKYPPTPSPPVATYPPTPSPPVAKPPSPPVVKQPTPAPPQAPIKPPAPPVTPPAASPPFPPVRTLSDCTPLCAGRCKLHSRPNVCNRACKACCYRCKCVPPGTYGNREKCGKCYTDMTTRNNKPKCP